MLSKEELILLNDILSEISFEDEEKNKLKIKLEKVNEIIKISDETQAKVSAIQEEINSLYKEGE